VLVLFASQTLMGVTIAGMIIMHLEFESSTS
jgi:hypothetical protein